MYTFFKNLFWGSPQESTPEVFENGPLDITDFEEKRYISSEFELITNEDFIRHKKQNAIILEYYDKNTHIGYIRYYLTTGQICMFYIKKEYQNRGLGKQILRKAIKEMRENHCEEIWLISSKNHPFWENIFQQSFVYRNPIHISIKDCDGYYLDMTKFEDA